MHIGNIRLQHKRFSVFGESLFCYVSPNRLKNIITETLSWISNQKMRNLFRGSQIDVSDNILYCRIHHDLSSLIQSTGYDMNYIDIEIDFRLSIVHVRLGLE